MPADGFTEECRTHQIDERWCVKHGVWEFYCSSCQEWIDHDRLRRKVAGWHCPDCDTNISGSMSYDDDDDVDELFDRAKAAYRRERSSEQDRIRRDSSYAYDWVQSAIGFLTAILNCFAAVWNSACYITTAVVQHQARPDDCRELSVLRRFRRQYIIESGDLDKLTDLLQYNLLAPRVIAAIEARPDSAALWKQLAKAVDEAVVHIDHDRPAEAYAIYKSQILAVAITLNVYDYDHHATRS